MHNPNHPNYIGKFLPLLVNIDLIKSINNLVYTKCGGTLELVRPANEKFINNIYFIVNAKNNLNAFELSELSTSIKEKLYFNYNALDDDDDDPFIFDLKSLYDSERYKKLFSDAIPYTKDNIINIENFFNSNFSKFLSSPLGTTGVNKELPESEKITKENIQKEIISFLQSNPKLWDKVVSNMTALDSLQEEVKKVLAQPSPTMHV